MRKALRSRSFSLTEFFFYIAYDKLVISVGSVSNAHGVPGLQYSSQLKTIDDAREIRQKIINNLERASLPSISQEERKRLLSFVVCGGGPTGVEFASEVGFRSLSFFSP